MFFFQGRYYDVVRQKLFQQHRQSESAEVPDVPVTSEYPFVAQITTAIRRIATGFYKKLITFLLTMQKFFKKSYHFKLWDKLFHFSVVQDYLYEFSQSYLPSDGAIARIISVISNGNPISGKRF